MERAQFNWKENIQVVLSAPLTLMVISGCFDLIGFFSGVWQWNYFAFWLFVISVALEFLSASASVINQWFIPKSERYKLGLILYGVGNLGVTLLIFMGVMLRGQTPYDPYTYSGASVVCFVGGIALSLVISWITAEFLSRSHSAEDTMRVAKLHVHATISGRPGIQREVAHSAL